MNKTEPTNDTVGKRRCDACCKICEASGWGQGIVSLERPLSLRTLGRGSQSHGHQQTQSACWSWEAKRTKEHVVLRNKRSFGSFLSFSSYSYWFILDPQRRHVPSCVEVGFALRIPKHHVEGIMMSIPGCQLERTLTIPPKYTWWWSADDMRPNDLRIRNL